jgi:hypothetical protein
MGGIPTCPTTTWRGRTVCAHSVPKYDAWAKAVGQPVRLAAINGSYSNLAASAGTHSGGGALDIEMDGYSSALQKMTEAKGREVGLLVWLRPWPGNHHCHALDPDCPDLAKEARDQFESFRKGRDGLAAQGPDTGPRTHAAAILRAYDGIPATPAMTATGGIYTVRAGDTLGKIAAAFKVTVAQLASWNGIKDVNTISVGQKVRVTAPPAPKPKPAPSTALPTLRKGSNNATVKKLQAELLRVFFYAAPIRAGGGPITKFGPATERVVREFQKRAKVTVDGVVGPQTWAALARNGVRM